MSGLRLPDVQALLGHRGGERDLQVVEAAGSDGLRFSVR